MVSRLGLLICVILLPVLISCNQQSRENRDNADVKPPKTIDLKIERADGVWKVINVTDSSGNAPVVSKNDKINWTAEGTDVYIQFPDTLFDPVGPGDILKHGYMKHQMKGKKLRLKVKSNAKAGTYIYAVFCTADSTFAEEKSPPRIIVED